MNRYALFLQEVTHALLLNALGRTTLLLVLAWIAARSLRRLSAAQQHFLWFLALLGVVYVTSVSFVVSACTAVSGTSFRASLPMQVWRSPDKSQAFATTNFSNVTAPASDSAERSLPHPAIIQHSVVLPVSGQSALVIMSIWLLGSLLMLFRLTRHRRAVMTLYRRSVPLENANIHTLLAQISARLGVTHIPILVELPGEHNAISPLTWGWRRPYLLFPADVDTWSGERVEAVLLHELSHIQRGDWLTQRMADVVCAFYWFHPLVWLTAKQMKSCAERACDDAALTHGIKPADYARQLLDIAQGLRTVSIAPEATMPFLRGSQLETRVRAILSSTASRRTFSRAGQRCLLGMGALSLVPLALALPIATQAIKYVAADSVIATNGKATLPGGVAVELLGIADTDAKANMAAHWWQQNGTSIPAPYDLVNAFKISDTNPEHRVQRIFSVRISGSQEENPDTVRELLLDDSSKAGTQKAVGSYGEVYQNQLKTKTDNRYTLIRTDYFGSAHLPERGTFRYGVALGAWHDIAVADPTLKTIRTTLSGARVTFKKTINKAYITKLPNGKQSTGLMLETQDNQGRVARRLVAITRQGEMVKVNNLFSGPEGAMTPYGCVVQPELDLNNVREFRLQTRPYMWAEFPDVALKPKQ